MKKMTRLWSMCLALAALSAQAQRVEISVGGNWPEIPAQQTQSELKPGWKIVDYQTKSRLTRYLSGGHATQLAETDRPAFRVTPGEKEVLIDYALIRLKARKHYRRLCKPQLMENRYQRLEPAHFDIRPEGDAFVCQPRQPLAPGEYILVNMAGQPIGELGDLLVYPFCVMNLEQIHSK